MSNKNLDAMSVDELRTELARLKDNLCDLEDMHNFTFGKTSVHIGAEKAQNMTAEYEEECKLFNEQIAAVEKALKARGPVPARARHSPQHRRCTVVVEAGHLPVRRRHRPVEPSFRLGGEEQAMV
ncbi:MAG TPA: hypothetical protein VIX18_04805, partial [Nitrospirota bacterium]